MKKLILIIFFYNLITYAQKDSGIITYKVYNVSNEEHKDAEVNDFLKKTNEDLLKLEFELSFNPRESLFVAKDALEIDGNLYFRDMALAVAGASNKIWYTDVEKIIMQYSFMNKLFLIEKNKNSIEWQLSKETKKIGDYLCYKATCILPNIGSKGLVEKKVEVWYAKDIPIQLGPLGLVGLPGLILEANFSKVSYVASNIKIEKGKAIKITKPEKGERITENDFFNLATGKVKEYREDLNKK